MQHKTLELGKKALFKHCDIGLIDIVIKEKTSLLQFYSGSLKKVHHKDVRLAESAALAKNLLAKGQAVDVFVQPNELIRYY